MNLETLNSAVTVSGLTDYLQSLLEGDRYLQQVWVVGEVSSLNDHARGLFFTLTDPSGDSAIQCVLWNSQRSRVVELPRRGEQFLVLGSVRLYAKRGDYKLNVWQTLAAGEGLQALRYQQLRSRLETEGLFDPDRKRALPTHPQIIAVITSPTAAAWGDIQRTLSQRYPGLQILFSPAIMQGEDAPKSISWAFERIKQDGRAEIVILARGGGAVEDLACFNDERVVRSIAQSPIPVITGLGHERDESLADLVADAKAHTPTAAAELAVPNYADLVKLWDFQKARLQRAVQYQLQSEMEHLADLKDQLSALPQNSRTLLQAIAKLHLLQQKLIALDPKAVLERGYAVIRQEHQVIQTTEQVTLGQTLTIQLKQGQIKATITDINP
ncbi:MAG: exodeoxyribonuclease VII large subunit [Snowella sp.]|nr:exodeoxyribonuclease VII large subunit [Snowella sp.]